MQEQSQPVVVEVPESAPDSLNLFNQEVGPLRWAHWRRRRPGNGPGVPRARSPGCGRGGAVRGRWSRRRAQASGGTPGRRVGDRGGGRAAVGLGRRSTRRRRRRRARRSPARAAAGSRTGRCGGRGRGAGPGRRGSPVRPRCPRVSRWTRRRTWSRASKPSFTTWKASRTRTASGRWVRSAVAYLRNGPSAATSNPIARPRSPVAQTRGEDRAAATRDDVEQPRRGPTEAGELDPPVTNWVAWVEVAARYPVSSTPSRSTPARRAGSSTSGVPYSATARITVPHARPSSQATAATDCPSRPTRRHASRAARASTTPAAGPRCWCPTRSRPRTPGGGSATAA